VKSEIFVQNFRADAKLMIDKIEEWIEEVSEYEKNVDRRSAGLKDGIDQAQDTETVS
jgi:hypothetical protein